MKTGNHGCPVLGIDYKTPSSPDWKIWKGKGTAEIQYTSFDIRTGRIQPRVRQ